MRKDSSKVTNFKVGNNIKRGQLEECLTAFRPSRSEFKVHQSDFALHPLVVDKISIS